MDKKESIVRFENQREIIKSRRRINRFLLLLFLLLLFWVSASFYGELRQKNRQVSAITAVNRLRIVRDKGAVVLKKTANHWQVESPYNSRASDAVIEAFLVRLNHRCLPVDPKKIAGKLSFYATVTSNLKRYQIGELNTASNRVYVKTTDKNGAHQTLALCDRLVASIALAPAIDFIDKQLYPGELKLLKGRFGSIADFSGIDLSVLQVAVADKSQIARKGNTDLRFVSDKGESIYRVLGLSADKKHILLLDPKKLLIYVIANNAKLTAILEP